MNYYLQVNKKKVVTAAFSVNSSNVLTRVSEQGISYPLLEEINWDKVEPCLEGTFNLCKEKFLKNLTVDKRAPKRFKANSKFNVILNGEIMMSGYSERTRSELSLCLLESAGTKIRVVDEQGITKAILNSDITEDATYTLFDI